MAFEKLDSDQKKFIKAKVKKLKTLQAVKKFYFKPCLVSRYAVRLAKEVK